MTDLSFTKWAKAASIGARIRWLIEARGYKQNELAEKMELTQATISNWITGASRKPNAISLLKLSTALDCNPQWIVDGTGEPWQVNAVTKPVEQELLKSYRALTPQVQAALLDLLKTFCAMKSQTQAALIAVAKAMQKE